MHRKFSSLIFLSILCLPFIYSHLSAQQSIDLSNIEIVRDDFGVPHIFTKTDREAAYGIAWAQCEDNFHIMQDNFGFNKNLSGRMMGKKGAVLDFLYQVFQVDDFVAKRYPQDISPKMEGLLQAYSDAVNSYAELHPKEVKAKSLFPLGPKDILGNYTLHFMLLHSSAMELGKYLTKGYDYALIDKAEHGSNAFAYSPQITENGHSYLIGNPHQPVNEMGNFWEVSVHSEEGYEFFGATFSVGGLFPVLGANRKLGWSHTTNYPNSADIYQLEMHPTKKNLYRYDGEWIPLEVKHAKLKVKLKGVVVPVRKKYYLSVYGPTFEKESGFYSFKSHAFHNLKAPEQWYKMGLAKNFGEFTDALGLRGLAAQTLTYADFEGNIYHLSNFTHPLRDESYDWSELTKGNTTILPGTTSANNWTLEQIHPISSLPQVKNPKCGYVYNCNNTVFKMTGPGENPKPADFPASFGLLHSNTVRGKTFAKRIEAYEKISFAQARKIREDVQVDKYNMSMRNCMNCGEIPQIINKDPKLADVKKIFDKWDGSFGVENEQASVFVLTTMYFKDYILAQFGNEEKNMPEAEISKSIYRARKFLLKHYGTLEVPLGKVQKAVRFDVEYPLPGSPNTLANAHSMPYKKGKIKIEGGDSFIFYADFGKQGLEAFHTINAFGNSLKEGHPHSTDQTEMYVTKQTKTVELDLGKLRALGDGYHPQ